jgi:NAD(P)-dependent dehydrogenase (short-subunit alcohol dehydrogenase family)
MRQLADRIAVVTGSASGIGRATALALAREGCNLALADVDEVGMAETAAKVREVGRKVTSHRVDVADKARMQAFADEVVAEHGAVHVLINNAGVSVTAPLAEQSLEDFEWIVGINFWGVVYGCKFFLPHLRQAGGATIVNLSSMFGLIGLPTQSSYCATKFAVRGFSESLAAELCGDDVDVISVHPGGIATNIVRSGRFLDIDKQAKTVRWFERFAMPPERAARQIVDGIKRRKSRVIITREAVLTDVLKRLYPGIPPRTVAWAQHRLFGK